MVDIGGNWLPVASCAQAGCAMMVSAAMSCSERASVVKNCGLYMIAPYLLFFSTVAYREPFPTTHEPERNANTGQVWNVGKGTCPDSPNSALKLRQAVRWYPESV